MHAEIARFYLSHIRVHDLRECQCLGQHSMMCYPRMQYAYRNITKHLSKAEPSADLREALLNTCYITSLIQFEERLHISVILAKFLFFLKDSVGICYPMPLYYLTLTRFTLSSNSQTGRHSIFITVTFGPG